MTKFKRSFKLNKKNKNPKLIWLALLTGMVGYWTQPAFAEGSKELTDDGGDRPFLEYRNDSTAGIQRRATIYVYAQDGETINLGSSAVGQGNGRIDYVAPNGTTGNCGATGQIQNRTQEVAGPTPNINGYTPCIINVVGLTQTGVWQINFISRNAASTSDPTPISATANWTQNNGVSWIAAWDVTVRNSSGTTIPGRTYAKYLPFNMGGNNRSLNSQTFIQTRDGYQYRVGLNGLDPYGFIFFANNKGFTNGSGGLPLYRSVDLAGATFLNPNTDDTSTDYTHKIFFNRPASDLPTSATVSGGSGSTWLLVSPTDPPQPSNFQFTGIEGTPNQTGTAPLNGNFTFNSPIVAPYTIVIDINRDGTFGNANDKIFNGTANVGTNTVNWDATDGTGVAVPPGDLVYQSQVTLYTGEVHFPLLDAENNPNGIIVERVNPSNSVVISSDIYYDDSALTVRGTDNPSNPRTGFRIPSTTGAHSFSTNGTVGPSVGFGDQRGIDTWVYVPSNPIPLTDGLTVRQADLQITKTHEPTNPVAGGDVTYVITVTNNGPSSLNTVGQSENIDARVTDTIPSELSNLRNLTCTPTGGSVCRSAQLTGNQLDARVNLPVNGTVVFRVTGTLTGISAGTTVVNDRAVVERSNDVTDPNDNNRQGINNNVAQDQFTVSANQPPVADDKTAPSTPNTAPVQVPTLTGSDPDGTVASYTITTLPTSAQGTLLLNGTPVTAGQVLTPAQVSQLIFQPNPNFVGNATFNYTVTDNNGVVDATPATVTLPVTAPANQPPVADDKTAPSTPNTTPVQVPTLTGSDPDGTVASYTITTLPTSAQGTLLLNGTPVTAGQVLTPAQVSQLIFQPNPTFVGNATFNYTVTDNNGIVDATPATVTLPVTAPANQPPVADDKTAPSTPNTAPVQVPTLTGSDPDGTVASYTITTLPTSAQGTLLLNGIPVTAGQVLTPAQVSQLIFQPNPTFVGNATFNYTVTDNNGVVDATPATVTLPVTAPANQPPVADDKTAPSTPNTTPVQVPTLTGSDPDGTVASYTITTLPTSAQGTLLLNGIPVTAGQVLTPAQVSQLIFQPNPNFVGNATFNYTVTDNNGVVDATPATVTLPVTAPANQPPVANNDSATTNPGVPVNISVLNNDTDPNNNLNPSSLSITANPGNGTVTVNPNGTITYTPNPGFSGATDTFTYQVCDTAGLCSTATVTVTVAAPVNQPPLTDDKTAPSTPNGTPVQVPALTGSDPDGTIGSFTIATVPDPTQGTLLLNGTPVQAGQVLTPTQASQLIFQPNPGFTGNASFTYAATDNNGVTDSSPATVTLPVSQPTNQPPIADDKTAAPTPNNTPVQVPTLTGSDPDGTIASFTISTLPDPAQGTLLLNGTPVTAGQVLTPAQASQLVFQPNPNFTGNATFTYTTTDNSGLIDSSPATVTLPVIAANQPPVAEDKTAAPTPNTTPAAVPPLTGSDPDGTIVSFTISTLPDPAQGTLLLNGVPVTAGQVLTPAQASQLVFQPNPNFTGNATFTYTTTDNLGTVDATPATVTMPVIAANQPPVAEDKTAAPTPNTTPAAVPPLTGSDPDGTIVSFTISTLPDPAQGTLLLNGVPVTAGQVLTPAQASQLVFQPNPNFTGNATFTYTTTDNLGVVDATPATVTLPVIAANQPPVAEDKTAAPTPNTTPAAVPPLTGSDPDGTIVSFTISTLPDPAQGTLLLNGVPVTAGQVLTPAQASQLVFQPNPNFTGNATFTYTTTDNLGVVDATPATVTLPVIAPPNQPPVANNDNVGTNPGTPVVINPLINDRDFDNNLAPSSLSIISNPTSGTVGINPDTTITYTPNPGFTNGIDSFVYQICDTRGLCDTATITVTVPTPTPLPPVANDDRASTNPNTPVIINVLGNDTDPNNNLNPTSVTTVSNPANGTVSVNPITGQITYTPNPGFTNGTNTFVYQTCDTTGLCDTATVTVTVPTSGSNPPIATNDSTSTNPNTPVILNILANDSDPDGNLNPASLRIVSNPANGTVTINPDGTVTYTPNPGFTNGVDTFVYEICDTTGLCTRATVVITVPLTIPKPPIAQDDFASTNPNTPVLINVSANDRDPEGNLDPTTIQILTQPANGRATIEPGTGQIIYYPNPSFTSGTDTFIYRICDTAGLCNTSTVSITVPVVGVTPPIANNVAVATESNSPVIINVLANANDSNGNLNPSSLKIVANPTKGTVSINPITGQITYTPNPDLTSGIDTFTFEVCDTTGLCTTANVTVRVPRLTGNQTDVQVTQTSPTTPIQPGNNVTFTAQVTNVGPGIATGVVLTNPLPPNTTFVSATPSQGSCELTNNNVVCNLGDLNPGQTITVPVVVTPTASGTITNQVLLASPNDFTPANNQASAIAQIVLGEPRLRLVKRITSLIRSGNVSIFNDLVDDPTNENDNASSWSQLKPIGLVSLPVSESVRSGDTVEYTIYFLSDGTTPADNVRICDPIPDNTTFLTDAFGSGQGMQLNLAGVISALTNDQDGDVGRFFSALAPLPTGNPCVNGNNPNGTVLFSIDRIPNTTGNNFGFVRFRVRID